MSVYDFDTYEDFFKDVLDSHNDDRGYRTKLAKAINVNPSYITRISTGAALVTPDQAIILSEFWGLSAAEKEYFLWLVLKSRAGNQSIAKMATEKLSYLKHTHDELGNFLPAEKVDMGEEYEYYMSWIYSAIHMLLTLPKRQTAEQLALRLGLSETTTRGVIAQLRAMGIIDVDRKGGLSVLKKNIHLSNRKWLAHVQHRNWRVASLERIGRPGNEDINYTGVHSLSKKDLEKFRRLVREFLLEIDELVRPSAEETVCVLNLDLFEL